MENIILSNRDIQCSEITEDPTALNAKFAICSFDVNGNGIKLNRETIGNWLYTLVAQPVVAKIGISDSGEADFTSHNLHQVTRLDEMGEAYIDYEFDSSACGVFTSAQIENINGKEYITATAKLWKRFPEFCAIVKKRLMDGTLNTSWEIATEQSHIELIQGTQIKVIDKGRFLGHSLLASFVQPAYPDSKLLEVASENTDTELIEALNKDIVEISNINNSKKEDLNLSSNKKDETAIKPNVNVADNTNKNNKIVDDNTETAMLTEFDLRKALREAISDKINREKWDFDIIYHFPVNGVAWIKMWDAPSQLDVITFTYTVENDVVTVSEPVNEKLTTSVAQINSVIAELNTKIEEQTTALVSANDSVQKLNTQISELDTYKEKFEKAEQEKIAQELAEKQEDLKSYAIKSGLINEAEIAESDDINNSIMQLDKAKINTIIAERFMLNQDRDKNVKNNIDTSSIKTIKTNLENSEDTFDHRAFMKAYLGR